MEQVERKRSEMARQAQQRQEGSLLNSSTPAAKLDPAAEQKRKLIEQIEQKRMLLEGQLSKRSASPDPEQQKRMLLEQIEQKKRLLESQLVKQTSQPTSPKPAPAQSASPGFASMTEEEREAAKAQLQSQLIALQNKAANGTPGPGTSLPDAQLSPRPMEANGSSAVSPRPLNNADKAAEEGLLPRKSPDHSTDFVNNLLNEDRIINFPWLGESAEPMAAKLSGLDVSLSVDKNLKESESQVTSPIKLRVKLPEDRLRLAFGQATWYAYLLLLWAILAFFLGIFVPFGYPSWGISVPTILIIVLFLKFCVPIQPPEDGLTMPRPIGYTLIFIIWLALSSFTAGILAAIGVDSIKPLLETPVCMVPDLWLNMVDYGTWMHFNSTEYYGGGTSTVVTEEGASRNVDDWNIMPLEVSLINVNEIEGKLGVCKAWNMCVGAGTKMLSCEELVRLNEGNAFFFFFSAFALPPFYFWIYNMISVRLQELHVASITGFTDVEDVSLSAWIKRACGCLRSVSI